MMVDSLYVEMCEKQEFKVNNLPKHGDVRWVFAREAYRPWSHTDMQYLQMRNHKFDKLIFLFNIESGKLSEKCFTGSCDKTCNI